MGDDLPHSLSRIFPYIPAVPSQQAPIIKASKPSSHGAYAKSNYAQVTP